MLSPKTTITGGCAHAADISNSSASALNKRIGNFDMQAIVKAVALGKQVATGYSTLTILDNVSFEIEPGEAVAIVGASGSGKTTLLGLLAGLDLPTSGHVLVDGVDLGASMKMAGRRCGDVWWGSFSSRFSSCRR